MMSSDICLLFQRMVENNRYIDQKYKKGRTPLVQGKRKNISKKALEVKLGTFGILFLKMK